MRFFAAFLLWPLIEIALFVLIGGQIGLWPTLIWVVVSGLLGMAVLRMTALRQSVALRSGLEGLRDPAALAAGGLMSMLAGVLLILPGFLTDALGLLLLLPPVQALVTAQVMRRFTVVQAGAAQGWPRPEGQAEGFDGVIDGDFTDVTPGPQGQKPSGWTRIE